MIDKDPRQLFFYIALPEALKNRFTSTAKEYDGAEVVDHVTLLFVPKASDPVEMGKVTKIISAAEAVGKDQPPILAKVQGWAYFDGAEKDGKDCTALVALVDAPGLAELHLALKAAMKKEGVEASDRHGFTPHVTFAYLKHGERVEDLPLIDGSFTVDKFCLANREIHEVKLEGSLGAEATKVALHAEDRIMERTKIDPKYLRDLEQFLRTEKLPKIPLYHRTFEGSIIALSPRGNRHTVSTVLSPGMKPKGVPLTSVLRSGKIPEPTLRKEGAVDFRTLWQAVKHV